jgi:hypothetical protein
MLKLDLTQSIHADDRSRDDFPSLKLECMARLGMYIRNTFLQIRDVSGIHFCFLALLLSTEILMFLETIWRIHTNRAKAVVTDGCPSRWGCMIVKARNRTVSHPYLPCARVCRDIGVILLNFFSREAACAWSTDLVKHVATRYSASGALIKTARRSELSDNTIC